MSAASGQGPRSCASIIEASSTWARMCLKMRRFHDFAMAPSNGSPRAWRKVGPSRRGRPTARALPCIWRGPSRRAPRRRRSVVEERMVADEHLVAVPLVPRLEVERGSAADRSTVGACRSAGQGDVSEQRFEVDTLRPGRGDAWACCGSRCRRRRCTARQWRGGFRPASGTGRGR